MRLWGRRQKPRRVFRAVPDHEPERLPNEDERYRRLEQLLGDADLGRIESNRESTAMIQRWMDEIEVCEIVRIADGYATARRSG